MTKSVISDAFQGKKAFIPFVTCGDPDLFTTRKIVKTLSDAGASVIELGIPFSDPTAEGPVIQEANIRSLAAGTTTDDIFDLVCDIRKDTDVPLVFMTYANVVFHYGIERFCKRGADAGINGLILPDTPFEERDEFACICNGNGLDYIGLIAPTSEQRIEKIARCAQGFVYCVSSLGVTGIRSEITTDLGSIISKIRSVTDVPIAIGFGISRPYQARSMVKIADGVIVGSAIVKLIAQHKSYAPDFVGAFAREMIDALDET